MPHRARTLMFAACLLLFAAWLPAALPVVQAAPAVPPQVASVYPTQGYTDDTTRLAISGSDFFTQTQAESGAVIQPSARLGVYPLIDVQVVTSATLQASVPAGLPVGTYPLVVTNPDGGAAPALANAFTLVQGLGEWQTGGPYGGAMEAVTLNPFDASIVYAQGNAAGSFVSRDGGAAWNVLNANWGAFRANWPVHDCCNPQVVYFNGSGFIHRSSDGGQTWTSGRPAEAPKGNYDFFLAADPKTSGRVYAGVSAFAGWTTPAGVFVSDDFGATWRRAGLESQHVTAIVVHPVEPQVLYAATREGDIYRSPDAGQTWGTPLHITDNLRLLYINPYSAAHELWAIPEELFWDDGVLFRIQPDLAEFHAVSPDGSPVGGPANWVHTLAFDPFGRIWAANWKGAYSQDGGVTWSDMPWGGYEGPYPPYDSTGNHGGVWGIAPDPHDPQVLYIGTGRGMYKSTNFGQYWFEINNHLAAALPRELALNPQQPSEVYAALSGDQVVKSVNGGLAWERIYPSMASIQSIAVDPFEGQRVYFAGTPDRWPTPGFFITTDGGRSFETIDVRPPQEQNNSAWLLSVAPDPHRRGHLLLGGSFTNLASEVTQGVILESVDSGQTWRHIDTSALGLLAPVYGFAYDASDPNLVWANALTTLLKSTDGGATWHNITSYAPQGDIMSMAAHPFRSGCLVVGFNNVNPNLARTHATCDAGLTWQPVSEHADAYSEMQYAASNPPQLFGTGNGLARSADDGHTFTYVPGMSDYVTLAVATIYKDNRLVVYTGTAGGMAASGAYRGAADPAYLPSGVYRLVEKSVSVYLPVVKGP